jgi:hypothetical protein
MVLCIDICGLEDFACPAEFWERYVRYLAASDDTAAALGALQRATQVHCRSKPAMHLFAARFQEQHGDVAAARASLELVTNMLAPDDIKVSTMLREFVLTAADRMVCGACEVSCLC